MVKKVEGKGWTVKVTRGGVTRQKSGFKTLKEAREWEDGMIYELLQARG